MADTYRLRPIGSNLPEIICLRGAGPPVLSGGYGAWDVVDRPHRPGITNWIGRNPFVMMLPILFDGWAEEASIEGQCTNLSRLAQSPGAFSPPPELFVDGGVPRQGDRWVLSDISWGTTQIWVLRNGKRFRVRQDANLTLLESIRPELIKTRGDMPGTDRSRTKAKATNSNPTYHHYTVKEGESLRNIAAREYGDARKWKIIAEANGIRGSQVAAGSYIRIPDDPKK